ncbi:hypothetical protein RP20_CCG028541 [Aedes albopictus]|nr:hypothetical protein RP20_CCG028541 [Aedes albopictus]
MKIGGVTNSGVRRAADSSVGVGVGQKVSAAAAWRGGAQVYSRDYDEEEEAEIDPELKLSEPESTKDSQQLPEIIPLLPTTTTGPTTEITEHSPDEHHVESSSPTPSEQHKHHVVEEVETRVDHTSPPETHPASEDGKQIEETVTDGEHVEEDEEKEAESDPTDEEPSEVPVKFGTCGVDRGGCDHECHDGHESHPEVWCSCYHGFLLDEHDGRTCHVMEKQLSDNGIVILGYGADGDSRLIGSMKVRMGLPREVTIIPHGIPKEWKDWFAGQGRSSVAYVQDTIHLVNKLKNALLSHTRALQIDTPRSLSFFRIAHHSIDVNMDLPTWSSGARLIGSNRSNRPFTFRLH